MKGKVLAIIALLLLAGTSFALESGPSNPVGFFTITVTHTAGATGYNLVSFPVIPAGNDSIKYIIGSQLPANGTLAGQTTNISWWVNNHTGGGAMSTAYYHTTNGWLSSTTPRLYTLERSKGYYVVLRGAAPTSVSFVVAGNVLTDAVCDMGTIWVGQNFVGAPYAANVAFTASNIYSGTSRFLGGSLSANSDNIIRLVSGTPQTAWYKNSGTGAGWNGPFNTFEPGKGYIVKRFTGRASYAWPDLPIPATSAADNFAPASPVSHPVFDVAPVKAAPVKLTPTKHALTK